MSRCSPPTARRLDVLLVTADNELRETVRRHRRPALHLACTSGGRLASSALRRVGELWLDLDSLAPQAAPDPAAARVTVCFQSAAASPAHGRWLHRNSLLVCKPCSDATAQRLWRAVPGTDSSPDRPLRRATNALPDWLDEFHQLGLRDLCRLCVSRLPARLGYQNASVYLHDPDTGILSLADTTHRRPLDAAISIADDRQYLMAAVARRGRLLRADDVHAAAATRALRPSPWRMYYPDAACLVAPLVSAGRLWGVLNLSGRAPAAERDARQRTRRVLDFIGRSLRYAREYEQARLEARIDVLTGLYNQRWMQEALAKEIRRSERFAIPLALMAADLDGLKAVNDRAGHAAGDCLLRHVARQISSVLRQFDSAARVGGDEFTVLLPATELHGARQVARRILQAIRNDAAIYRGLPLPIRASLGVAQCEPGWNAAQLIEAADQAMYLAKRQGRDQLVCREPGTTAHDVCLEPAAPGN